jgi:hypothetical protein
MRLALFIPQIFSFLLEVYDRFRHFHDPYVLSAAEDPRLLQLVCACMSAYFHYQNLFALHDAARRVAWRNTDKL